MEAFEVEGRKFAVRNPGASCSSLVVAEHERRLSINLPPQLRSYYLRWNGGLPFPLEFAEAPSLSVRLRWLNAAAAERSGQVASLGVMQKFDDELEDFVETCEVFKRRMPQDVLPFQRDGGGSLFVIGVGPTNLGKIFFWDREFEANVEQGDTPGYDNIADVAPSFVEFLLAYRPRRFPGETDDEWIRRNYGTD